MKLSLIDLSVGKKGTIVCLNGGVGFQKKIVALNIRIGKELEKVASQPFAGPIVIRVDNRKITIGRGIAAKIFVEVVE